MRGEDMYVSEHDVTIIKGAPDRLMTITVQLVCTDEADAGFYNPDQGGQPPADPEFDVGEIIVTLCDGQYRSMSWSGIEFFFGSAVADSIMKSATEQALSEYRSEM